MDELKKEDKEFYIAKYFLDLYPKEINYIRNGNPLNKEADIICSNNFNIEIVSNYYSEEIKKKEEYDIKKDGERIIQIEGPDKLAFDFVLNQIKIKNEKLLKGNYSGTSGKFVLLIFIETQITYVKNYKDFFDNYFLENNFDEVWLLGHRVYLNGLNSDIFDGAIYNDSYIIYKLTPPSHANNSNR